MKTLLLLLATLSLASCRTGKYLGRMQHRTASEVQNHSSTYSWSQQDSNNRYWLYWGDSSFYYHPERGLYASHGNLWVEESQRKNRVEQSTDSSFVQRSEASASQVSWSIRHHWHGILWVLVAVVGFFYLRYR